MASLLFSELHFVSCQIRWDKMEWERYETNLEMQNISAIHRKLNYFQLRERILQKIDSRGWFCICLLGFHYAVRRGRNTSGKNTLDRAWQLNLFAVFSISWFTYSTSVLTAVAPPSRHWFRKHLSAFPHHRKWLQIKASLNQEAVKASWKQSLAEQQAVLGAQWNRDQSMHLTICQPPFLASD